MSSISRDAVVRVYRWYAPFYDLVFGRILEAGRVEMAKVVDEVAPESLLEVGVGTGLALPHYPDDASTVGIDLSMDMLKRAKAFVSRRGIRNDGLICADAETLPFADSAFECITLPYVLSVTPDPDALMRELRRVCEPGGYILILNHFKGAGVWRTFERLVEPLAERVGFRSDLRIDALESPEWQIERVTSVNLFGLSKLVVLRNARD